MPTSKNRRPTQRPAQKPAARQEPSRPRWQYGAAAAGLTLVAVVLAVALFNRSGSETSSMGLPHTPDYHSLLVSPADPQRLTLGTHNGLFVSVDGGRHWRFDALSGDDAMNLARPTGKTIWLAGHQVFKKSVDGGASWVDVHPTGLPGLDIHGFAVDPRDQSTLYAAIAGQGLYRSGDSGRSFALVSRSVGGSVMALAITPDGRILAGDMQQGLLESRNGKSWQHRLRAQLLGLAINPRDPKRVLATGAGIALSTDGGHSWRSVLDLPDGAGPVAWSTSNPRIAYAVGFNRTLYRSSDSGESWQPVGERT
jgi:photosystem II stability/assembly factor-like uncharacterized protein